MEPEDQKRLKQYITEVLDAVAYSIGDGIHDKIGSLEDLQAIIEKPKVRNALDKINNLVPRGMDLHLRGILEDIQKRYKSSVKSKWVSRRHNCHYRRANPKDYRTICI